MPTAAPAPSSAPAEPASAAREARPDGKTAALVAELARLLPPGAVLSDPASLFVYESDGFTIAKARPAAVVFPTTTEQVVAVVKAVAAGAFTINRLNAVKTNAQSDPTLCKLTIAPITKFTAAVQNIVKGGNHGLGSINTASVTSANGLLSQFHSGAARGGNAFTDNQNANIGG